MILAIDTATRWAGLALHDGTAVITEVGWRCANTHTIEITPAIGEMLGRAGIEVGDLKAIAVAIGPGSYTGLRVGLAIAKGLALAHQTPLIGVPTLDIVAAAFGPLSGQLLVTAAAGRTRVCAAVYRWQADGGWQAEATPVVETWENLLAGLEGETFFAGEITPEAAELIQTASPQFHVTLPAASTRRAGYLAELGWHRFRQGRFDDAQSVVPIYLRDPAGR
ncbi:MAG: tRNA (adenosine(37)-N6)-threonylcarbamoyltransferase complex dimerization subunit type 1 TsaB [Anaerolineae bacterium]